MKKLIRYFTRWAWRPVLHEFVRRQALAEKEALRISQHATRMYDALDKIAHVRNCQPVLVARRALTIKAEGKQ